MAASKALPEGWEECSLLKYIPLVTTGVKPFNGTREYVETGDLDTGKIRGHQLVTFDSKPSRANQEVQVNDVIFAKMKDTEKVFIISKEEENYIFSTGFAILRILNLNKILPSFLYYWLRTPRFQKKKDKECTGATQKAINTTSLEKFKIVLPPLPTQRRIVSILEKAEETKRLRAQADELTDRLLQSVFLEMFGYPIKNPKGWETRKMSAVSHINMGQSPPGESYSKNEMGTPLLNGPTEFGDIHPTTAQWTDRPTKICNIGNILFCVRGATAGRMNWADQRYCIGRGIAAIQSIPNLSDNRYLYQILLMNYERFQATGKGSTFINISSSELGNLIVPVPPLPLQQKFARIVEKVESMRRSQNQSKQQIEDLFSALMQKAFKGELVA